MREVAGIERAWVNEGLALRRIRDQELWQASDYPNPSSYSSFTEWAQSFNSKYSAGYVSRLISGAETAIEIKAQTGLSVPNENTAKALRKVDKSLRVGIAKRASEIAVNAGRENFTSADVNLARVESMTNYADAIVYETAQTLGWERSPDRVEILMEWYASGKDRDDSKFWAALRTGVIDPADGKPIVRLRNASLRELRDVQKRWASVARSLAMDEPVPETTLEGKLLRISVDGQIPQHFIGRKVRITIIEDEESYETEFESQLHTTLQSI